MIFLKENKLLLRSSRLHLRLWRRCLIRGKLNIITTTIKFKVLFGCHFKGCWFIFELKQVWWLWSHFHATFSQSDIESLELFKSCILTHGDWDCWEMDKFISDTAFEYLPPVLVPGQGLQQSCLRLIRLLLQEQYRMLIQDHVLPV